MSSGLDAVLALWPHLAAALYTIVSLVASGHAVLHKRDTRAAIGWVGTIWLAPIIGTLLYFWLEINRIGRRARALRTTRHLPMPHADLWECSVEVLDRAIAPDGAHLTSLARLVGDVTRRPLV